MKAEEYKETKETLAGWPVRVVSYRLGSTYHVSISNEEPGARIVRGAGPNLAEVEAKARKDAAEALAKMRRHPAPTSNTSVSGS